jgi:hypothetical protein
MYKLIELTAGSE